MAKALVKMLRIVPTTGRDTYRAIGRAFGRKATDVPVADLNKAQIEALKADPWLSVTEVEVPVETADQTKGQDKA